MKKSSYKTIFLLYSAMFVLSLLIIIAGILFVLGVIASADPNGNKVKSNWPLEYTRDFAEYIELSGEIPSVEQAGILSLDNNRLWLQILDESGHEVYAHNTASTQPNDYSPIDFLELYQSEGKTDETIFIGTVKSSTRHWAYVIGFPMNIARITMYLNGDSFTGGRSIVIALLSFAILLMLISGGLFGVWIIRHMRKMAQAIGQISYRLYEPIQNRGPFQDVYNSLNDMSRELRASDEALANNEAMREEWITNITHDLKTPLSPIKGYAELLADSNSISDESRIQYGRTILRNTEYAEKLVNDLKLTYQLKNNMLPLDKKQANLARFLREIVIEILNHPAYSSRTIVLDSETDEIVFSFDQTLFTRALNNLIFNALLHNPPNTEIRIVLRQSDRITIAVDDNGKGMSAEEADKLFQRYYRGTSTEAIAEGTGLGMAIAEQIIELHGGSIVVESELGKGTHIEITLPCVN